MNYLILTVFKHKKLIFYNLLDIILTNNSFDIRIQELEKINHALNKDLLLLKSENNELSLQLKSPVFLLRLNLKI